MSVNLIRVNVFLKFLYIFKIFCTDDNEILSTLREQITEDIKWPTKEDVAGSVFSLFTIQYTFKLPITKLARGIIGKRVTHATLTVEDIEHIVNTRFEDTKSITNFPGKDYALAVEWIEGAVRYA